MVAFTTVAAALPAHAQLTAGTGKADITPSVAMFPFDNRTGDAPFSGIHDRLFARALVLDQDGTRTVLVGADMINMPDAVYERIARRIAARFGTDPQRIWITATHVHTVPWTLAHGYERTIGDGIVAAIADAVRVPEPVTIGTGTGRAEINVNRDERTARGFILGQDPSGASDKAVRVVGFFRKDGTPKAILVNYAVHAVVLHSSETGPGHSALVSADLPGATNAFVDAHYPGVMNIWTSGAAADQNPVMMSIYAEPGTDGRAVLTDLKSAGFVLVDRWGQNLGLEITRVVDAMRPQPFTGPTTAAGIVVRCPAKTGDVPRSIRVSWLRIGPVDLLGVSGELATSIDAHLRASLAGGNLITLTLTNGYAGYLPDEASFARGRTFEVEHSSVAPGCAENAIVDAAAKLVGR